MIQVHNLMNFGSLFVAPKLQYARPCLALKTLQNSRHLGHNTILIMYTQLNDLPMFITLITYDVTLLVTYFLVSKDFISFCLSIDCLNPLIHLLNVISLSLLLNT